MVVSLRVSRGVSQKVLLRHVGGARSFVATAIGLASVSLPPTAFAQTSSVVELTVRDVETGLASGTLTSAGLVGSFLDRINTFDGYYKSFISLNLDARSQAAALDAEYRTTGPRSPLHGVPVVIKDNMDLAGFVTTNGFRGFSAATGGVDLVPGQDATLVSRLEGAGAVILGKTNLPDFAQDGTRSISSVYGRTVNPTVPAKVPGGSSGGSAVATNASFAVLGMGTETGTSIHNPATFNALVGIRPTQGLVPIDGIYPLSGTFRDVTGPIAKTVYDAAVTLDAIAGESPRDRLTAGVTPDPAGYTSKLSPDALGGARVGYWDPAFNNFGTTGAGKVAGGGFIPQSQALYDTAIGAIEGLGSTIVRDKYLDDSGFDEFFRTQPASPNTFGYDEDQYLKALGDDAAFNSIAEYNARIRARYAPDAPPSGFLRPEPSAALLTDPLTRESAQPWIAWRDELRTRFESILDSFNLDVLAFPVHLLPLVNALDNDRNIGTVSGAVNILGIPGVMVNAGYFDGDADGDGDDDTGDPFGLIFLGRRFDEANVLGYAFAYEQATLLRQVPVLIPEPVSIVSLTLFGGVALLSRRRRIA